MSNCISDIVLVIAGRMFLRHAVYIKVKVKFTLEQATKDHRGSRGIAPLFNLGARWVSVANAMPWPNYHRERDPVLIVQEVWWASRPVWTGAEISSQPGFDPRTVKPTASRALYIYIYIYIRIRGVECQNCY